MVHTILSLAYSKEHMYYMPLTCSIISSFWNLLCSSVTCDCMTMTCDCVMLTPNFKSENKKMKINRVHCLLF